MTLSVETLCFERRSRWGLFTVYFYYSALCNREVIFLLLGKFEHCSLVTGMSDRPQSIYRQTFDFFFYYCCLRFDTFVISEGEVSAEKDFCKTKKDFYMNRCIEISC